MLLYFRAKIGVVAVVVEVVAETPSVQNLLCVGEAIGSRII